MNRHTRPKGNIKRGTRAFRAIRREYLNQLGPNGWQTWTCPICHRRVPRETDIHLDHLEPVWIADHGNKKGIDANTLRTNCRLLCASCNTTRGRGRTDQHVAQLRARKIRKQKQTNTQTITTQSTWTLTPKRKTNE